MVSDTHNRFNKAFVTGATGFVGRALVDNLLLNEFKVVALVRDEESADLPVDVEIVQGNLSGIDSLAGRFEDCDIVFHLAARTPSAGALDAEYMSTNVDGTALVVELCQRLGKRLVYVSTVNVALHRGGSSSDLYSKSKSTAERLVTDAAQAGLDAVVVRPAYVFGNKAGRAGKLVDRLLAENLRVIPSTSRRFCPVFVGDLAEAIRLAGVRAEMGSVYTVAGDCLNLGEFVDKICDAAGLRKPMFRVPNWIAMMGLRVAWAVRPITRYTPPLSVSSLRASEQFDGGPAAKTLEFRYTPLAELF